MKQVLKTAIIGYFGYKAVDALVENRKNKEEKKEEEYVPFDDIEVKEEPKQDTAKNVAMFVGGLALGLSLKPTKKVIEKHYIHYFK